MQGTLARKHTRQTVPGSCTGSSRGPWTAPCTAEAMSGLPDLGLRHLCSVHSCLLPWLDPAPACKLLPAQHTVSQSCTPAAHACLVLTSLSLSNRTAELLLEH